MTQCLIYIEYSDKPIYSNAYNENDFRKES